MASTYLTRSISSGGSDLTKFTYSVWIKRSAISGSYQRIFSNDTTDTKDMYIRWQNNESFHGFHRTDYSTTAFSFSTNAKYRDVNGWYHLVVKYDSTQSTQSDRLKIYVNGEEPSMASITYPSLNQYVNFMNNGEAQDIGFYRTAPGEYFDGYMSHIHFTAGYAYDASYFGETDSTTGEWKIKTSPNVTYGSLGYFILKDGNSVTDQSGNGNNFTVGGGTLTNTEDCPSNVFATWNPLDNFYAGSSFSHGNTTINTGTSGYAANTSTLGMSSGKWYCEIKAVQIYNGYAQFGIKGRTATATNDKGGTGTDGYIYTASGGNKVNNNTASSYGTVWNNGDIIGIAVDLDNNYLYFSRNGTWQNSGDPTSGASGTGAAFSLITPTSGAYYFCTSDNDSGATNEYQANFGNGYFGTTAVSSAGTNASGNGIFEYDVPTGYTALSTKGLNL